MQFFAAFLFTFLIFWAVFAAGLPAIWRGISRAASFVARRSMRYRRVQTWTTKVSPFRDYLPVAAIVVAGLVFGIWAGDGFLDLAESVTAKSPRLQTIDTDVHNWAVTHRGQPATVFFVTLSTLGGPAGVAAIVAVVALILAFGRRWRWVLYLAVTAGGGALLDMALKHHFARARPELAEMLRRASGYSFPSGHAMGTTVAFCALSYVAFRASSAWWAKSAWFALACTMIVFVSLSRVYLGVHWISDVGAGIVAGLLWVAMTTIAYETLRRIRAVRVQRSSDTP